MPQDFHRRAAAALDDNLLRTTLTRSTRILNQQRASAFADTAPFHQLQAEARAVRLAALAQLPALLEQLERQARANGIEVFWAEDAAAANRYLQALVEARRVRQVVRSHSTVVDEIGLDAALSALDIPVIVTQVGDYIVQLGGDTPSHMVYPALHRRKEDVADLFEARLDVPRTLDIQALASMVRFKLRRPIMEATLSVSGVTFGVAENGTLVLTSDNGDDRFALATSPLHVAIMGIDQVTARLDDLALLLPLFSSSASGRPLASYTTWLSGPMPADAPDGPLELQLILLDNGRSDLLRWGYDEALTCIRCGACQQSCPVYREVGGQAYSNRGGGPIDAVFLPLLPEPPDNQPAAAAQGLRRFLPRAETPPAAQPAVSLAEAPSLRGSPFADLPQASTLCGACADVCPVGIDIPRLLIRLRGDLVEAGQSRRNQRLIRRAYRWGMSDPARYRRLHRWLRSGSLLRSWPQPAAHTFRQRWQARRGS